MTLKYSKIVKYGFRMRYSTIILAKSHKTEEPWLKTAALNLALVQRQETKATFIM